MSYRYQVDLDLVGLHNRSIRQLGVQNMKLDLQYDSTCDAWTLRHENVVIRNAVDIEQWKQQLMVLLERMGGERGYLLIDMHGFELDPEIADDYGVVVK